MLPTPLGLGRVFVRYGVGLDGYGVGGVYIPGFERAGWLEVVEFEKDVTASYFGEGKGGDERRLDPWLGEVRSGG